MAQTIWIHKLADAKKARIMIRRFSLLILLLPLVRPVAAQTLTLTTCSFTGNAQPIQQWVNGTSQTVWAYMRAGDTWACPVNAAVAGDYAIMAQAATYLSNQAMHLDLPKGTTVGSLLITGTGSWSTYRQQSGKVTLPAGASTVLLVADGDVNLGNVLTLTPPPPSPLIPPPPSPNIMTVKGPLFWCTKCDGSDDKPVTGSLVVSQTGGGQVTVPINPDGTVGSTITGAIVTVDPAQDPQEYLISLSDVNGVAIPGASLRLAFPQDASLFTISWSVARFATITDASGNPAAKVIIWSDLIVSK